MRILILISLVLTTSILNSQDYFSDRLFVKLKEEYKTSYVLEKDKGLRILLSPAELVSAKPVSAHPFLNSTYELILDKVINLDSLILRLNQIPEIEFAEKVPLYKLFFTPNDPLYSTQWNLSKIQADLAWNLSQGCANVKVAVTDDGFLMTHEDLVNQWHINTGEIAGNGIDDDGNSYIDDWRGWDAANNDNDPSATSPTNTYFTHGTHVAGIIAGQTHNSKGIAAIGYNCKMIPVKIGLSSNSFLTGAFQGLDYAVNASGCDVINMSWGGGGWSATYQTLFNIAKTKGIICVAAAGNSNTSTPMYPASYNHVISVAASASADARASFSNFGSTIDVTAPGVGIPSCLAGATNSYGNLSGTSMASPLVAGLCALMKCYNPMPADSIEACLKRTCDNINAQNPSFIGQLGAGRINAFQALQCLTKKPKSDFIALDTFQCTGKSVRYAARSFGIPTLTYNWSFPGGGPASSTAANPVVSYTTNGYKTASLITCNSLGCDTITKTNLVNIDTPKASLIGRKYTSYNSNPVPITIKFTGNPPYSVTLTDGTNTWTQSNIKVNPYFLFIVPKKDTSLISISAFSDSLCVGNRFGVDTIHRTNLGKDTTTCVVLKTSNTGAIDGFGLSPTTSTNITWTFTNNENVVANWTAGGVPHFWRNILKFNLAGIPANAIINSASLSLYSKPNASHGWTGQPTAGTDNSTSISRITNAWTISSISTSSWPSITTQNQVILTQSPTNNHSYLNIDVKNLVQDLITTNDFGLFLRHVNTPFYNSLIYYSAEETDTSKHPKLVLCYTIPGGGSSSGGTLCRDSAEINSAQTGWQALQTNGSWSGLSASNYCAGAFTSNASVFPGMTTSDCIWGPTIETGNRTAYNSASWTTTSVYSCSFVKLKKSFSLPSGSIIDSVRLWMVSDDFIDSVWVNDKLVFKAINPLQYGQILILGNETNIGNSILPLNEVIVKSGDAGGCYGSYFRMKVYYRKVCGNISDCDTTNLNTGKVLHLDFNGNTQDKSGLGNHATNYGATLTSDRKGNSNSAYSFNGSTSPMVIPNFPTSSSNNISISVWFKSGSSTQQAYAGLLDHSHTTGTLKNWTIEHSNTNSAIFFDWRNSSSNWANTINDPVSYDHNKWNHLVVVKKTDTLQYYLNCTLVFEKKYTGMANIHKFVADLNIGFVQSNSGPFRYYNGSIDELSIYHRVLTLGEIKALGDCCSTSPPPSDCDTSGLVLCMSMDGNANDSTKFAHNGIVRGATLTTGRNGISNSAYYFDGATNHISLGVKPMLKPNAASISVWVKPHAFNSYTGGNANCIFLTKNPNNPGSYMEAYSLYLTNRSGPTKFMTVSTHQPTTNEKWFQSNQNTALNQWTHLVLTFDTDSLKLYINGQLDNKVYKGFTNVYDALDSIILGYSANTTNKNYFKGDMDELKMYNRVLSASEVSNLYIRPFSCSCNSIQLPPCETAQKFTYTQCLNDSIQISAGAGSKYQWSPVFGLSNDTIRNPKVFVTSNQRYLVSYTSTKNCQLIDTIDVEVKAAAIYLKMDDQLICIGDSVQMTIPIHATNILWSPNTAISSTSSKNPFFFPTTPTTYYLEFRDTFGCLHRDTFVVNTKVCCPARARFTIPKDQLCFGETIAVTNTSKGPITSYNWNFSTAIPNTFTGANPPILTFPSGGSYTLKLIVTNGTCFDTMIKTVNVVHIIPYAGLDTTNCLGAFVTDLGELPISDWTYKWTPTKYLDDPNIANPKCSIVNDSVNYILEITDRSSGCKASDTVVVYTNRKIDSIVQNLRICDGDSVLFNGIQRKTTGNYFYTIKKADGICDSFINLLRLNVLQKQFLNYTPKIHCDFYIDGKGKRHDTSYIERDTIRSKSLLNCDSIINITPREIFKKIYIEKTVQGCSPFRYNGKTYLTSKTKVDSIRIRGAYSGCDSIIEYIDVIVYPKPKAEITPSIPNPVLYKQTVTLTASGGQTYLWLQMGSTNSEIDYKLNQIQPRLFTVRVTDDNNCWDTVSYIVNGELPDTCYYGFPNAFTPNQDGLNDEYMPNMDECTEIKVFAIYDRWGEKVFETNQQKGWNGFYKGKPAPPSVYLYYAELITPWGIKIHKGNFTLIR